GHGRDLAIDRGDVTQLEQAHEPPAVALELEAAITARARERHDLARGHEALLDAAGSPDRLQPEVQREGERRGIAEAAGHRDGVSAERVAALGAVRPVQRHRQASLPPYAHQP